MNLMKCPTCENEGLRGLQTARGAVQECPHCGFFFVGYDVLEAYSGDAERCRLAIAEAAEFRLATARSCPGCAGALQQGRSKSANMILTHCPDCRAAWIDFRTLAVFDRVLERALHAQVQAAIDQIAPEPEDKEEPPRPSPLAKALKRFAKSLEKTADRLGANSSNAAAKKKAPPSKVKKFDVAPEPPAAKPSADRPSPEPRSPEATEKAARETASELESLSASERVPEKAEEVSAPLEPSKPPERPGARAPEPSMVKEAAREQASPPVESKMPEVGKAEPLGAAPPLKPEPVAAESLPPLESHPPAPSEPPGPLAMKGIKAEHPPAPAAPTTDASRKSEPSMEPPPVAAGKKMPQEPPAIPKKSLDEKTKPSPAGKREKSTLWEDLKKAFGPRPKSERKAASRPGSVPQPGKPAGKLPDQKDKVPAPVGPSKPGKTPEPAKRPEPVKPRETPAARPAAVPFAASDAPKPEAGGESPRIAPLVKPKKTLSERLAAGLPRVLPTAVFLVHWLTAYEFEAFYAAVWFFWALAFTQMVRLMGVYGFKRPRPVSWDELAALIPASRWRSVRVTFDAILMGRRDKGGMKWNLLANDQSLPLDRHPRPAIVPAMFGVSGLNKLAGGMVHVTGWLRGGKAPFLEASTVQAGKLKRTSLVRGVRWLAWIVVFLAASLILYSGY